MSYSIILVIILSDFFSPAWADGRSLEPELLLLYFLWVFQISPCSYTILANRKSSDYYYYYWYYYYKNSSGYVTMRNSQHFISFNEISAAEFCFLCFLVLRWYFLFFLSFQFDGIHYSISLEFSFSLMGCHTKVKEPVCRLFIHIWWKNCWIHVFLKGFSTM